MGGDKIPRGLPKETGASAKNTRNKAQNFNDFFKTVKIIAGPPL
jgi:hypothetical protein